MSKSPKKSKSLTRAGNRPATISAQQTIPYVRMLPDGICQLPGGVYTKTLEYEDINYSVASAEDQTAIFGGWSSWLNYFDSSLPFQLSFVNRRSRSGSRYKVNISEADDRFNSVRTEYTGMLKNQIAKSNNGIERAKYVTFCIPAENVAAARPRLERVEADVIGNFKRLGVQSQPLDGRERLALLHGQLHPGSREPFRFKWADIAHTGMGTKDFIVPDSFDFRQSRSFRVGQTWGAASYLQIMASELSDKLLLEILELDAELTVTMHIQTVDQVKAIKTVKGKISDIDKMKVEEQRKAISVSPMCGAAAVRPHPLTAPASSAMSTINAAGASGGWGRRAFITSAPGRAAPAPVIWCSLSAPMTQRVFLMWASMWATAGCSIVATLSAMPT